MWFLHQFSVFLLHINMHVMGFYDYYGFINSVLIQPSFWFASARMRQIALRLGAESTVSSKSGRSGSTSLSSIWAAWEWPERGRCFAEKLLNNTIVSSCFQKAVLPSDGASTRAKKLAVSAEPTNFENQATTLQHYNKTAGLVHGFSNCVSVHIFLFILCCGNHIELVTYSKSLILFEISVDCA